MTSSMSSLSRYGLTRPMRLVARIATRTIATCGRYGRKKATIRRIVLPRRSFGIGGPEGPPPNGPPPKPTKPPPRARPALGAPAWEPTRPNPPPRAPLTAPLVDSSLGRYHGLGLEPAGAVSGQD